jgi:hypothetical protein
MRKPADHIFLRAPSTQSSDASTGSNVYASRFRDDFTKILMEMMHFFADFD